MANLVDVRSKELIHNTRNLDGQSDKKNPQDFALWKKAEPQHHNALAISMERWFPRLALGMYRHEY